MSKIDINITLKIPDKEPYEGKATQKQKKYIWELGFRDQEIINDLGKKQASSVIDQLSQIMKSELKRRSAKTLTIITVIFGLGGLVAKATGFPTIYGLCIFVGMFCIIASGVRWLEYLFSKK